MAATEDGSVLCVGLVCLDVIYFCRHYPQEDEDVRAQSLKWSKGGNAANMASVLSLLGRNKCHFLGTLGSGVETESVNLSRHNINILHSVLCIGMLLVSWTVLMLATPTPRCMATVDCRHQQLSSVDKMDPGLSCIIGN